MATRLAGEEWSLIVAGQHRRRGEAHTITNLLANGGRRFLEVVPRIFGQDRSATDEEDSGW
jgi:hypothetical protein